jgi:NAD-dependent dihydropyrimidine dehydrogenase PreA subunit
MSITETGCHPCAAKEVYVNSVRVRENECKGCAICVSVCPKHCLHISDRLNTLGYAPVAFDQAEGCTACGLCFLSCPEPGALTVLTEEEVQ